MWGEVFSGINNAVNMTSTPSMEDNRSSGVKMHYRRRLLIVLPFLMLDFRHVLRDTKMHSKGQQVCFSSGTNHSSRTFKVRTEAGITTYSSHCTFDYRWRPFQAEVPTSGEGRGGICGAVVVTVKWRAIRNGGGGGRGGANGGYGGNARCGAEGGCGGGDVSPGGGHLFWGCRFGGCRFGGDSAYERGRTAGGGWCVSRAPCA